MQKKGDAENLQPEEVGRKGIYNILLESALVGFMQISSQGKVLALNSYCQELLDCVSEEHWHGRSFCCFLSQEEKYSSNWRTFPAQARSGIVKLLTRHGKTVRAHYQINLIDDAPGHENIYLCQLVKVDSSHSNQFRTQLHRNALIREVHHQIKNHLQAVMSLLEISIMERPEVEDVLHRSLFQVSSLAITFGLKSQHADGRIFLCDLIESSANFSGSVSTLSKQCINLEIPSGKPFALDKENAVPVSLVVNELILNAIKHSVNSTEPIEIRLTVDSDKSACLVIVNHAGKLPEGFDFEQGKGLGTGLSLVKTLLSNDMQLSFENLEGCGVKTQLDFSNTLCWIK